MPMIAASGEAEREHDEARPEIIPQLAAADHHHGGLGDRPRRREQHRIDAGAEVLPQAQHHGERDEADRDFLELAAPAAARRDLLGALAVLAHALEYGGAGLDFDAHDATAPAACAAGAVGRAWCSCRQMCARNSAKRGSARTASTSRGRPNGMSSTSLMRPGRARHHRDAVAEHDRLVDRMGDEHHGLALVGPLHELQELLLQDLAGLRVERGERLVHQQDRRIDRERAHEADALLHAAGELIGILLLEAGEADEVEIVPHALLDDGRRRAGHGEPEGGVLVDGLPRQQAEMLEHHGDARRRSCDRLAEHRELAGRRDR